MNEGQIKTQIFLIKAADSLLVVVVFGLAIYTYLNPQNMNMMVTLVILGLFILNRLGHFTLDKIARLRHDLDKLEREKRAKRFQK